MVLKRRRYQDTEELFPLPSADASGRFATRFQEIRDLETLFEEGDITWSEYCRRLKQLAS